MSYNGKKIVIWRVEQKIPQYELAKRVGISGSTLVKAERSEESVRVSTLVKICLELGKDVNELFE